MKNGKLKIIIQKNKNNVRFEYPNESGSGTKYSVNMSLKKYNLLVKQKKKKRLLALMDQAMKIQLKVNDSLDAIMEKMRKLEHSKK